MSMFATRPSPKKPEDVFTPRSANVNDRMYVPRPDLEASLRKALAGTLHILLHGESGSGKSWLYKKVLATDGFQSLVVNLATAANVGSIAKAFSIAVERNEQPRKVGYTEKKAGEISAVVAKGVLDHQDQYVMGTPDPVEQCLSLLHQWRGMGRGMVPPISLR